MKKLNSEKIQLSPPGENHPEKIEAKEVNKQFSDNSINSPSNPNEVHHTFFVGKDLSLLKNEVWKGCFDEKEILFGKFPLYKSGTKGPIIICMHGAGHSALTFSLLALELKQNCRIYAFDFRGHGENINDNPNDLSVKTLIEDCCQVVAAIHKNNPNANLVILGHSMGGSIATKFTKYILDNKDKFPFSQNIKGIVIIDVVEGTAMEALPYMESVVSSRPKEFESIDDAVDWNVNSSTIHNYESSKISTIPLLKEGLKNGEKIYTWITDLLASKIFWEEWFKGLTNDFLSIKLRKLLVVAGSDRLDKDLIIAQMQGKFKYEVVPKVGHVVQEDNPKKLAQSILQFVQFFKID